MVNPTLLRKIIKQMLLSHSRISTDLPPFRPDADQRQSTLLPGLRFNFTMTFQPSQGNDIWIMEARGGAQPSALDTKAIMSWPRPLLFLLVVTIDLLLRLSFAILTAAQSFLPHILFAHLHCHSFVRSLIQSFHRHSLARCLRSVSWR